MIDYRYTAGFGVKVSNLTNIQFEILQYIGRYSPSAEDLLVEYGHRFKPFSIRRCLSHLIDMSYCEQDEYLIITQKGLDVLEPYRVKSAVILAAGFGSRMLPVTKSTPKPMVKVNGRRFVETQIDALLTAGIEDITIVRGHRGDAFDRLLLKYPLLKFVDNPDYTNSNNAVSAYCAGDVIGSTYLIEGDLLILDPEVIRPYEYRSNYCGVSVDNTDDWNFTVQRGIITDVTFGSQDPCYQYVGISFWSKKDGARLYKDLSAVALSSEKRQEFIEAVPFQLYPHNYRIKLRAIPRNSALEIDTFDELCEQDPSYLDVDHRPIHLFGKLALSYWAMDSSCW